MRDRTIQRSTSPKRPSHLSHIYQWLADGTDISGATNSSYTQADADEGKAVSVRVSFTDDASDEENLTSAATARWLPIRTLCHRSAHNHQSGRLQLPTG